MKPSCHTYEWVMPYTWMYICMSHTTHMTYEWVTSHIWMCYFANMTASYHTHEWLMARSWMRNVTHIGWGTHEITSCGVDRSTHTLGVRTCIQICCANCSVLQCVAVCYSVLQCIALRCRSLDQSMHTFGVRMCSVLQCGVVWCSVVQCGAVCYCVLHCGAACCSVLQRVAVSRPIDIHAWYENA